MPDKYIVNMTEKTTPEDTNLLVIEDAVDTKKITFANLVNPIKDIVDSGSNSNGSYIRFSDGTMICSKKAFISRSFENNTGIREAWEFPATFIQDAIVIPNATAPGTSEVLPSRIHAKFTGSGATSSAQISTQNTFGITLTISVDVVAIGRWK